MCSALVDELPLADSGVAFVYRALAAVVEHFELDDAVLVLDDAVTGRQVFRHGGRPLAQEWSEAVLLRGSPGLYTRPGKVAAEVARTVVGLSIAALRYDLARHDATHDGLTGLLNRRAFDELLATSAGQSARYGWPFTLVLFDLDNFKAVNDRLGHHAGDAVLRAIGLELRRGLRNGDMAARVGGDEFAMVLANADPASVDRLVGRLRVTVREASTDVACGVTVGLATAPTDAVDPVVLYTLADKRLYEAKHR